MTDFPNPFAGMTDSNKTDKKENANMADQKNGITTTIKFGSGFDAPWGVLHTADLNEANEIMESEEFGRYAQNVVTYSKAAQGLYGPVAPATRPAPAAPAGGAMAGLPAAQTAGKSCQHGARTMRTGTNARGQWTAWFCPQPKGAPDQCKAIFE
ncbi:hypothetical protein ACN20G_30030 (plasmid) [Streptomyces sp. BI20]|uniref:hypothetical protein n=1 Tax=Streptomyces sp. BI20 TaxID=3403460 RepID=UPI003C72D210